MPLQVIYWLCWATSGHLPAVYLHGVCGAQTDSECHGAMTFIQAPVRAGEQPNPRTLGTLPAFGLRLKGLTLKLKNPVVGD
jgi:hypothetical protein